VKTAFRKCGITNDLLLEVPTNDELIPTPDVEHTYEPTDCLRDCNTPEIEIEWIKHNHTIYYVIKHQKVAKIWSKIHTTFTLKSPNQKGWFVGFIVIYS